MEQRQKRPGPGRPPEHEPVVVWETGNVYETYTEAAQATGCSRWGVMRCCTGMQSDTHGYHFCFASELGIV